MVADYAIVLRMSDDKVVYVTSGSEEELKPLLEMLNETSKDKGKFEIKHLEPGVDIEELENDIELLSEKI